MTEEIPTVTHTGALELLGHEVTLHTLSDGRRVFEDTPELRALFSELGVTITDQGILFGIDAPIEAEVVK